MSFASDVRRISRKMQLHAEHVAAETIKELFIAVIRDTPVDTGRLRGNWQTTIRTPASGRLDRIQTGRSGEATQQVTATVTKPNVYLLTNNLPYAARIEYDGWSHTKAPQGMVRRNVRRIRTILRKHQR